MRHPMIVHRSKGKYLTLHGDILQEFKSQTDAIAYMKASSSKQRPDAEYHVAGVYEWTVERQFLKKRKETFIHGLRIDVFPTSSAETRSGS